MRIRPLERHEVADVWSIDRAEVIDRIYHHRDGALVLEPEPYDVRGWPEGEPEQYGPLLLDCFDHGGTCLGAFDGETLVGAAVLESRFIGPARDRLQLKFLHVSRRYRRRGLGRTLFDRAVARARELGARQLYVSATPSENTVDFYLRHGCRVSEEVDPGLFALEPKDIHLVLDVARMHPDEIPTDVPLVRSLLEAQLPAWAGLPLEPVESAGTDNALYRLGDDMVVRLPRIHWAVEQVAKEHEWLPRLAPLLPLAIPAPLARGEPGSGYPWHWSVYRWLEGEPAAAGRLADLRQAAKDLAGFVAALQRVDATHGPPPGSHNFCRGVPLADRDAATRAAIDALHGELDTAAARAAWEAALRAPAWEGPPVWIHGDLQAGNLLVAAGRLTGVIDFGGLGVGDPACDLIVAWSLFVGESRRAFRDALHVDEATWVRGRGWALSTSLIALPYYRHRNPELVRSARHTIEQVLGDRDRRVRA